MDVIDLLRLLAVRRAELDRRYCERPCGPILALPCSPGAHRR
jgi:hypothetical protein